MYNNTRPYISSVSQLHNSAFLGHISRHLTMRPLPSLEHTVQHKTLAGENFSEFITGRKLVEKILVADHTNNSSLFELTTFGR